MSAATATIITGITLAATTGTALYAAHKQGEAADAQSSAASHAADLQTQAQRDATAASAAAATQSANFQRQVYNDRAAALAPYRNAGANAFTSLSGSFGLSPTSSLSPNPTPAAMLSNPTTSTSTTPSYLANASPLSGATPAATVTGPTTTSSATAPASSTAAQGANSLAQIGAQQQTASTYTMRAPNGETSQVPAALVAHYQQLGAQVVH